MTEGAAVPRRSGPGLEARAAARSSPARCSGCCAGRHRIPSEIIPDDHLQTFAILAAAVLVAFLGVVLSAWRWQRVLRLFDATSRSRP